MVIALMLIGIVVWIFFETHNDVKQEEQDRIKKEAQKKYLKILNEK